MPDAAFYRSQAEAFRKLANVIEGGDTITADGQMMVADLRDLARQYLAKADRIESGAAEQARPFMPRPE